MSGRSAGFEERVRRLRRIVFGCGALLFGLVAAFALAVTITVLSREDLVERPLPNEERDLPPIPPRSDNGWALIDDADPERFELDPPGRDLLSRDPPAHVEDLDELRSELEHWTFEIGTAQLIEEALARPRFVIACALSFAPEDDCRALTWMKAHRMAVALTLRDLLVGSDLDALERTGRLLRADRDSLGASRTIVSHFGALACTGEAFALAVLVLRAIEARADNVVEVERLEALHNELLLWRRFDWSMDRALTGEWILSLRGLDLTRRESRYYGFGLNRATAALGEHYGSAIEYARDPDDAPAPELPEIDWVWRLSDPIGTLVLETLTDSLSARIDQAQEQRSRFRARLAIAIQTLEAALARANDAP
jgi:hypothetical protein